MKNTKCKCCKKFGHFAQDCPLDPNIKTLEDPSNAMDRIIHIKDSVNDHFADGQVRTVQFLKTCAKIPNVVDKHGELPKGIDEQKAVYIQENSHTNAFMRGAMQFEDYNYHNINQHVLIDPNAKENLFKDSKIADDESHQTKYLSAKSLFTDVQDEFLHDEIVVMTEQEKDDIVKRKEEIERKRLEELAEEKVRKETYKF